MDELAAPTAEPDVVLPDGYDDVDAFLSEARKRFQEGVDSDRDNRDAGLEDLQFLAGEQWDAAVKANRLKRGKPCLTINTLPQYLGQVIGDTRANRPSIKVRPAEDGDKDVAEVRQGLIRFIENQSNATQVYSLAAEDQVGCGLGHFRIGLEYTTDDAFDQDIRIRHIPNPFAVVWDPQSTDPTGADARFCFVVDEWDREAFEKEYPDASTSSLTVPMQGEGDGAWISRDTVRVTEYWLMKDSRRRIALVQTVPEAQPQIVDITDREDEYADIIVTGPDGRPRVRDKVRKVACMYLITGQDVLDGPYEYPISRVPVIKVTGREVRVGARRYRFGLIRFAKDSVRVKNLMRSAAMEWVAKAPKQQWLLHASDEAEANRYRKAGNSDDPVLTYNGQVPPQRIDPPTTPAALLQEAQFNDQDIKDVTGLHDASLGMRSNETSGKAILARERQGDTATMMYHDNLNLSIREGGRVVNELLPVIYDTARTVVVLGEDEASKLQPINDPSNPESVNLGSGKYDIVVETGPSYSTKRVEAAESMMAFVQAVPQAGQIAGDLIAAAQDWPMAESIAKRLKAALPPQIAEDEDEQTPEQMQARQQAAQAQQEQQQLQQQAQQLAMAKEAAEIQKLQADAAYTMAQAQALGQPNEQQPSQLDEAIKFQQLRKAQADADKAEAEAAKAAIEAQRLAASPPEPANDQPPEDQAA